MIFAIGVICFCAGVLGGVGFGIWYERGQQRREDDLFRARMNAYHRDQPQGRFYNQAEEGL